MAAKSRAQLENQKWFYASMYFYLENGLQCLVVSDPVTDKTPAPTDVSLKSRR